MKSIVKYFFRFIRLVTGPLIIAWEYLTTPGGIQRPAAEQEAIDRQTSQMLLFHFRMCPFCVKVRHALKRLSLNIEMVDPLRDAGARDELLAGGGKLMVPCLKITSEQEKEIWIYESRDIVAYLEGRFASPAACHRQPSRST